MNVIVAYVAFFYNSLVHASYFTAKQHKFLIKEVLNMETISQSSTGPAVCYLQLALTRAGFSPGPIDCEFGPATDRALRRFQSSRGLSPDGIAGPLTWNALHPYLTGYVTHIVQRGNSFWSLAREYDTSLDAISVANPGLNPRFLTIGQTLIIPLAFDMVPTNVPYTHALVLLIVEGLRARYPFIQTGSIGQSVLGRSIPYLRLGTGATEVSYNAAHHANEWITTPVLLKFAEDYAKALAFGGRITGVPAAALAARSSLFLIPMVNPDGVDLVTGGLSPTSEAFRQAQAISQNYPNIPFPSGWKANIAGIDPNLSYPALWEQAREIKFAEGFTTPAPRDYVGPASLAAPESRALYDFTLAHDFALILAYHTQGEVIYWKFQDYLPPRSLEIALLFGQVSGYAVEETPYASGFAGYKDWFIQNYNRPGYTIEAGLGESPLPLSQFDQIYADNLPILSLGLQVV
jgi:g-D-glutamyl-meso-diaminopimelate peptidase